MNLVTQSPACSFQAQLNCLRNGPVDSANWTNDVEAILLQCGKFRSIQKFEFIIHRCSLRSATCLHSFTAVLISLFSKMIRPVARTLSRPTSTLFTPFRSSFPTIGRRFGSTAPVDKPRPWKSTATRWAVVIAGLYYYNTNKMFAEEPAYAVPPPETDRETEVMPTIDELATQRRQQALARQSASTSTVNSNQNVTAAVTPEERASPSSPEELEEEAEGEGAFNPETGEINWDCPCLGGMAHGPCGEQFKTAFSCFVYSKEEPKGIDCIENFKYATLTQPHCNYW